MKGPRLLSTFLLTGCLAWPVGAGAKSLAYSWRQVLDVPVHVITADLNDPHLKVTVATADGFPRSAEPFHSIIGRTMPSAAVTGTYFSKATLRPVGDIVSDGRARHFGGLGTALAITPYNMAEMRTVPYGRHQDWAAFETVLGAGPRLLREGEVVVRARAEGFSDPHVLGRAQRTAVGLTGGRKMLLVVTRRHLTLTELAKVMQRLGCREAMNLDGGASTGMYYRGWTVVAPQRPLVNLLVIHEDVPLLARSRAPMSPAARAAHRGWRLAKAAEHYAAGERLLAAGHRELAARHYAAAVELNDTNASYCRALAHALEEAGRPAAAARAYAWSGSLLNRKGLHASAARDLVQSLALNAAQDDVRTQLAATYRALAEPSEGQRVAVGRLASRRHARAPLSAHPQPATIAWMPPTGRASTVVTLPPTLGVPRLATLLEQVNRLPRAGWIIVQDARAGIAYACDSRSWPLLLALTAMDLDYVHVSDEPRPVPGVASRQP